jgi:predicted nucleic acid-binding Zn ribbon protein
MIYTYRCSLCSHKFDESHTLKEYMDTGMLRRMCPKCLKSMLPVRVFTISPVIYKGTGFYSKDSRKKEDESGRPG